MTIHNLGSKTTVLGLLRNDVVTTTGTGSAVDTDFNTVSITTKQPTPRLTARLGTITSSCGVCGHDSIADLAARLDDRQDARAAAEQVRALMFVRRFREDIERRLDTTND